MLTTDVANIREARNWLLLFVCVLNFALGIAFLRGMLRPGCMEVSVWLLVCSIAIGLLRMLKLFGWESYIDGRIENKREAELACIRRQRVPEMAKEVAKCAAFLLLKASIDNLSPQLLDPSSNNAGKICNICSEISILNLNVSTCYFAPSSDYKFSLTRELKH